MTKLAARAPTMFTTIYLFVLVYLVKARVYATPASLRPFLDGIVLRAKAA